MSLKAAVCDVDGVYSDSLNPHLQYCKDQRDEHGLYFSIPSPQEFKQLVRSGKKVSPMRFFLNRSIIKTATIAPAPNINPPYNRSMMSPTRTASQNLGKIKIKITAKTAVIHQYGAQNMLKNKAISTTILRNMRVLYLIIS